MKVISEFYNYFKSLMYSPKMKGIQTGPIVAGYLILVISVQFSGIYNSGSGLSTLLVVSAGILFICGAFVSVYSRTKPNLATLMPVSSKKGMVYTLLSPLFLAVISALCILVLMIVAVLVAIVFIAIINSGLPAGEFTDEEIMFNPVGLYGGLFSGAYFVIMYSASLIPGYIKTRKNRNMYLVALVLSVFLMMLLIDLPHLKEYSVLGSPFLNESYVCMTAPWLCVTLCWVVAAALFGTLLYLGIKQYRQNIKF